ncbi:TPA: helix-turn-helix transcriptional regulator [Photobacterium damselae]
MAYEPIVTVLKNRRIQKELTQEQLAKLANMSEKTYQRIEQGTSDLKMSQYRSILHALGITDLDVSLDLLDIEVTTPWDVAAAARVLLPQTRNNLVKSIMTEWQRAERLIDATLHLKKDP